MNPDFSYNRSDNTQYKCVDCNSCYTNLYTHIQNSSCEYPHITTKQQHFIEVLLLLDAELESHTGVHHTLHYTANNPAFARWVQNTFGGVAIQRGKRVSISLGDALDELYQSLLEAHQAVDSQLESIDIEQDSITMTPQMEEPFELEPFEQLCIYAETGTVETFNDSQRISFNLTGTNLTAKRMLSFFHSFSPIIWGSRSTYQVSLSETEKFFEYIEYNPVPGISQKRWPVNFTPTDLLPVSDMKCPNCEGLFLYADSHMSECMQEERELSVIQKEFIKGLLLGGGFVNRSDTGWFISVEDVPTEFANWLDGFFEPTIGTWKLESSEDMCAWGTYPSKLLEPFGEWTDEAVNSSVADRSASQYLFMDPTELYPSDTIIGLLFVLQGAEHEDWVQFDVEHILSEDIWDSVFHKCRNLKVSSDGCTVSVDKESIRKHLQNIPYPGFEGKWL